MIAIVGGGISGLAVSHYLSLARAPHVVLEAAGEPGGVMATVRREGVPLDLGPQRTRLTRAVAELVAALGLEGRLVTAPADLPLRVYRHGRLREVPLTVAGALSTDLLSWRGKLRTLLEPLTSRPEPHESVEQCFRRKFGDEAYEALLGPLYGGLYASDPARMKVGHALAATLRDLRVEGSLLAALLRGAARSGNRVATVSFDEGMAVLPRALASRAAGALRLDTPAERIERRRDAWLLHLGGAGAGDTVEARAVVLALPAAGAARLLERAASDASARLAQLRYNPLAVVHLRSDLGLRGLGYQVGFGEALETRGVTWNASMFDRDGIFTAYLGGMRNPGLVDRDDGSIGALAADEFKQVTGADARVVWVSRTAVPAWDESWDALTGLALPPGTLACAGWHARPGLPGRLADARRTADRLLSV